MNDRLNDSTNERMLLALSLLTHLSSRPASYLAALAGIATIRYLGACAGCFSSYCCARFFRLWVLTNAWTVVRSLSKTKHRRVQAYGTGISVLSAASAANIDLATGESHGVQRKLVAETRVQLLRNTVAETALQFSPLSPSPAPHRSGRRQYWASHAPPILLPLRLPFLIVTTP